jgi:hypothetical protein
LLGCYAATLDLFSSILFAVMSAAPAKLAALRDLLAAKFPASSRGWGRTLTTGLASLDQNSGGLTIGALTEVVCAAPSTGGYLLLARLLESTRAQRLRLALIDGSDTFDPQSFTTEQLAHLVWVRCPHASAAIQAADLLARDANLGLVVLDLRGVRSDELRRIPPTAWYKLQRAVEQNELAFLIETSRSLVPSALVRFSLDQAPSLAALDRSRTELIDALQPELQRQRRQLEQEAV